MDSTLTHTKLHNITTLASELGEAGGLFLSIEPLMRYLAEINKGIADIIEQLIKADKPFKNKRQLNYWDCDPKYLIEAIVAAPGSQLSSVEIGQLRKYLPMRGKFLHGNFIELMEVMGIEPISRQLISVGKWKKLEPGQIYESLLSMKKNEVFAKLRLYSTETIWVINDLIIKSEPRKNN
jgi:hypothetical protein